MSKGASRRRSATARRSPRTDWSRFDAITDIETEASLRSDPDAPPLVDDDWFASPTPILPKSKKQISIRLDRDGPVHFRRYSRYQTRINAILRAAIEHEKEAG